MSASPLIVTLRLETAGFACFEDLRQTHFPPERNQVPAHLTLFHALPGDQEEMVVRTLAEACQACRPFPVIVRGPWSLGRGVAYRLAAPELDRLRSGLADAFAPWLTRQDQAPFRPHVTIQNKVEPEEAKRLLETLQWDFEPFNIRAEGLLLWRYLDGPWEPAGGFDFAAD